jgi:hypothetical protein
VITDGRPSYPPATKGLYMLEATNVSESGRETHELLLGTHVVFSLVKRWVLSTLQGSVLSEHLQAYFNEWVFSFNRRLSRSRGVPSTA